MIRRSGQRLRAHGLLNGALWLGLVVFFAMLAAVPTYLSVSASAILTEVAERPTEGIRPRLSYFFSTGRGFEPRPSAEFIPVADYLKEVGSQELGIPTIYADTKLTTRRFEALVVSDDDQTEVSIGQRSLTALDGAQELLDIVAGTALSTGPVSNTDKLEVLVAARTANAEGLVVGDSMLLIDSEVAADTESRLISATVVGLWEPIDQTDQRWVVGPSSLVEDLVISPASLTSLVEPKRPPVIRQGQWYVIGSSEGLSPERVEVALRSQGVAADRVAELLPGVELLRGPEAVFDEFGQRRDELQSTLRSYAIPGALIAGLFVLMSMGLNANQRQTELAVLRSRGIPIRHTLVNLWFETVIVTAFAMITGAILSLLIVAAMARTRAFLQLGAPGQAPPFWQPSAVPFYLLAVAALAVSGLQTVLFIRPARQTIVSSRGRFGRAAELARGFVSYADLAIVAVVVSLVFQRQTDNASASSAGLDDPWVIVLPPTIGLAFGLLLVRFLPKITAIAADGLERLPGTTLFLATKRMSRAAGQVRGPLVLIVVSTSLAAFLASLSGTLERDLVEETKAMVGAEVSVVEVQRRPEDIRGLQYYQDLRNVEAATQLLELDGRFGEEWFANGELEVFAIDPRTFSDTAYWQRDYASDPLQSILAGLDNQGTGDQSPGGYATPDGVIVSQNLATAFDVGVGEEVRFSIAGGFEIDGSTRWLHTNGTVTAVTDRFPRWSETDDHPLLVMNVNYFRAQVGDTSARTTLLRTSGDHTDAQLLADTPGTFVRSSASEVDRVRSRPDRQGIFGILTATFVAATVLALLALGIQSLVAYRERAVEIGVLRAIGLSFRGLATLVAFDVIVLSILGVGSGTIVGVLSSLWLIPDVAETVSGAGEGDAEIAWAVVGAVSGAFLAAVCLVVMISTPLLKRLKIFKAIKLGESL